jgi:hypothetical protein
MSVTGKKIVQTIKVWVTYRQIKPVKIQEDAAVVGISVTLFDLI